MKGKVIHKITEHPNTMEVLTDTGVIWVPKSTKSIDYVELLERIEEEELPVDPAPVPE